LQRLVRQVLHPLRLWVLDDGAGEEEADVMIVAGLKVEILKSADAMAAAHVLRVRPDHLRVVDATAEIVNHTGTVEALRFEFVAVVGASVLAIVVPVALRVPIVGCPRRVPPGPVSKPDSPTGVTREN